MTIEKLRPASCRVPAAASIEAALPSILPDASGVPALSRAAAVALVALLSAAGRAGLSQRLSLRRVPPAGQWCLLSANAAVLGWALAALAHLDTATASDLGGVQ
jgi:hypothetical protein